MDGAAVSARPRIAIAGFQHETNTIVPGRTTFADFEDGGGWPPLTRGAEVVEAFRPLNIPIGGFIKATEGAAELIPVLWTNAEPANRVTADAFNRISAEIIDACVAAQPDAIYLDLHGAMVTEEHDDGEGELLRRLRVRLPETPVAVSLDLHANISEDLAGLADVITIYRTYPHLDMDATGARAWAALARMLASNQRPAKAFRRAAFQIPLSAQCTDYGPLRALYDRLEAMQGVETADIALAFPLAEVAEAHPSVVAYAVDQAGADAAAGRLVAALTAAAEGLPNPLLQPEEAIRRSLAVARPGRPAALADVQDNSGAGATSDTTGLLAALIAHGEGRCLIGALCDGDAAKAAHRAGVGAALTLSLGGHSGPEGVAPLPVTATVIAVSDGRFVCTGAMQRDVATDVGASTLLRISGEKGKVDVLVTSRRHQAIDAEVFRHLGVEPTDYTLVAVKSTVHFRADFTPLAAEVIPVISPGYSPCT